eukprot:scaffold90460_cov66-Cyclotella_meneghiniana.AAC.2
MATMINDILIYGIDSANSSRSQRSEKRSTLPSSLPTLSFNDATTDDILRAAIVLNKIKMINSIVVDRLH